MGIVHKKNYAILELVYICYISRGIHLRAIGAWTSISHGQDAGTSVLQVEILISKLCAIDTLSTSAIEIGEVTTLTHELWNHAMENSILVMQSFSAASNTFLSSAICSIQQNEVGKRQSSKGMIPKSTEILGSPRHDFISQSHFNSSD